MGKGQPATTTPIDPLLKELWENGGTDLLLTAGSPPLIRMDGVMTQVGGTPPLRPEHVEKILFTMLTEQLRSQFDATNDIDFSFNWQGIARFRANAFRQ